MATGTDPRKVFTPRLLPWLVAIAAFILYTVTLNHWISFINLVPVANISGWTWQPQMESPLLFIITYPFRWLPAAAIPLALNFFAALCAAITLGLLTRSVAVLAQDRTGEQRKREHNDFGFLTIPSAWLPPLFAALACGLQLSFWERATSYTGDTFDLLIFAFVIWSLLEYRLDEREGRLYLASLVYGAGMAENFAMVGFLPVFLIAIIWIRGFSFFNLRFIGRMALSGFVGTLFYLFLPLALALSRHFPVSFWVALKTELVSQWMMVKYITVSDVRHTLAILSLSSLLPVLLASIRWKSSFGDASRIGNALATWMFHGVHAVILFVCVWVMFDPPGFSPRHEGYGLACLPFYYLTALCIGYYSGYFLLVFRRERSNRSRRSGQMTSPGFLEPVANAAIYTFAAAVAIGLVYKNARPIYAAGHSALGKYAGLVEKNLPDKAILLCDSDSPTQDAPWRLFAVQAALARDGKLKNYVPVDTKSLTWAPYHRYLHRHHPDVWPQIVSEKDMGGINPHALPTAIALLMKSNAVYYLHPSIGYYFEQFYLEPHGVVYKMKLLPDDAIVPPVADKKVLAENTAFWSHIKESLPALEKEISPGSSANTNLSVGQKIFRRFHISTDPDAAAVLTGTYLSADLDFWGAQLQRAGDFVNAGNAFESAQKLNPENVVAKINFDFNKSVRDGNPTPAILSEDMPNQLTGGPVDEPSYCFQTGSVMIQNGFYKQAVAAFERVRSLAPENLASRYLLGQLYLMFRRPDDALAALQEPMLHPQKFSLTPENSTQLNVLAAEAYFLKNDSTRAVQLLNIEINRHLDDTNLLVASVQAFVLHGLYDDALSVIEKKLASAPGDPLWLFGKGYVELQKKNYSASIAALTRVLQMQTNNNDALFNRAIAYLDNGQLDAARADYLRLQKAAANSYQVAYGLGEIAWRQHDTNEAIRNYEIYLAGANTNSPEAKTVSERLQSLKR